MLGIEDDLAYYDNYPSLFKLAQRPRFSLEESQKITLAALAPLGDEYLALLKRGFESRWTDSHPRPGKSSGAYVMGIAYDVPPYVLLNHNDDFESLSYGFYVWQYATSLAGAAQFADAIQKDGAPARDRFLNMLKAGGSDYAYEIYRRAGIDLGEPAPYQALVRRMDRLLDEIEALERAAP